MGRVQGGRAIVTAATDGIGLAIARRLCLEGAHVLISSRKPANVERAVAEIEAVVGTGPEVGTVEGMVCHVGKRAHREVSGQTQADTPALDWSHNWWTGSWTHKHTSQAISATSGATSFRVRASSRRSAAGFVAPACAVEVGWLVGWGLSGEGENR